MLTDDTSIIAKYAGGTAVSILVLAYGLQKLINGFKTGTAESSILTLMHSELERMSAQNANLSMELGRLQVEVIALNSQLRALTTENQRLHSEVGSLTTEVSRLQHTLQQGR